MTGMAVKKKRFEGLIQFHEPLRQALTSIQAAHPSRFATSFQSDFIKHRDTPELSHFLLALNGSEIGEIPNDRQPHHLLMAIERLEDAQIDWKKKLPENDVNIAAWLNSGDLLVCQQVYRILAAAASNQETFGLDQLLPKGAIKSSFESSEGKPWMGEERLELFKDFKKDTSKIFKAEKSTISTDGCTVSLMIEGDTNLSWEKASKKLVTGLKSASRHLVIVNYTSGPNARLQCVYLTPMRLPLKELQTVVLKGFVLLRDIKPSVKFPKTVLVS